MNNPFFEQPILNSPYGYPGRHWELDEQGQPTQRIIDERRKARYVTPIPKPKKQKKAQRGLGFDEGHGLSTDDQQYEETASRISEVRAFVDQWRKLPESAWGVTPETARLLKHWRHHSFSDVRPFFCQVEAVETAIWLTEVAPHATAATKKLVGEVINDAIRGYLARPTRGKQSLRDWKPITFPAGNEKFEYGDRSSPLRPSQP